MLTESDKHYEMLTSGLNRALNLLGVYLVSALFNLDLDPNGWDELWIKSTKVAIVVFVALYGIDLIRIHRKFAN